MRTDRAGNDLDGNPPNIRLQHPELALPGMDCQVQTEAKLTFDPDLRPSLL